MKKYFFFGNTICVIVYSYTSQLFSTRLKILILRRGTIDLLEEKGGGGKDSITAGASSQLY